MEVNSKHKNNLKLLNNSRLIDSDLLQVLLQNCYKILSGKGETCDISNSSANVREVKQVYASLLYIFTEFVRHNQSKEDFSHFIRQECVIEEDTAILLENFYEKCNKYIKVQLINIGTHLPHVTDVKWKIDYIVKSNAVNELEGPRFRISLKMEKFNEKTQNTQSENCEFSCSSQELQDLVYKLKDAVRHCQKLAAD